MVYTVTELGLNNSVESADGHVMRKVQSIVRTDSNFDMTV